MSWLGFGPGLAIAGALALAGALFALQRLRVRHRQVTVVTTLFWKQAVEETRARVLTERFRHPLAYLLVLAIALATWFAAAGPRPTRAGARDLVLLLDGSAGMGWGGRFDEAKVALRAAVHEAPRDARTVLWCGAEVRTLLLPGEDPLLLDQRLQGRAPEAAPASVERALWDLARLERARPVAVRIVGDAPVRADLLAQLPSDVDVARLNERGERGPNQGITALGVSAAESGAWDRVDVLVEVTGADAARVSLDGVALRGAGDGGVWRFTDLPAEGGTLLVELAGGDALAADDRAELLLPTRRHLRVVTGSTLPGPLRAALAADPAVRLVGAGEEADLVVRRAGEAIGAGLPAFELADSADQADAFLITSPYQDPGAALVQGVVELGLDRIDATRLADETGVVISAGAQVGAERGLSVWAELCGPGYDLVEGRTFPLLVGRTVRWLGEVEPFAPTVAAGRAVSVELDGLTSLAAESVPPTVGAYTSAGAPVAASLLAADLTSLPADALEVLAADTGAGADWILLLTLMALLLVALDGVLHRTGRTP